jgi:hypothetical protein
MVRGVTVTEGKVETARMHPDEMTMWRFLCCRCQVLVAKSAS